MKLYPASRGGSDGLENGVAYIRVGCRFWVGGYLAGELREIADGLPDKLKKAARDAQMVKPKKEVKRWKKQEKNAGRRRKHGTAGKQRTGTKSYGI